MSIVAIIPARSGSKGMPHKNIALLEGKPLLAYSIEAAISSGIFDEVMVSTDSEKYAKIALEYGAKVPFLRSEHAASDIATTRECIIEVLTEYEKIGKIFDRFMILQPTSPLREKEDILGADKLFFDKRAKTVVSLCPVEHSPLWCNTMGKGHSIDGFLKAATEGGRQQELQYYRLGSLTV